MGTYVDIHGVNTWYEEAGDASGEPLVLLHGGMSDGRAWFPQIDALAARFHVFNPDRRAHGRTPDVDGPLTYDAMAGDTIAFIEQVIGGPAHLVGWSDGGNVALLVSINRPDLVRRQAVIGANFHHEGLIAGAADLGDDPEAPELAIFKASYESGTADGAEHWPEFFAKTARMWREEPTLTIEDLARIPTPTLVVAADDEPIHLSHTVAMFEALPAGQLAVVPASSHMLPLEKPAVLNDLLLTFLTETAPPTTFLPVRRATP